MRVTLEGGCLVSDMREGHPAERGTLRIWDQIGRASGAEAISLRVMEFAPGLSPTVVNHQSDQVLYVLEDNRDPPRVDRNRVSPTPGSINFLIDDRCYEIGSDTGIFIRPEQTFAVENLGPDSIVMISSRCPDPGGPTRFHEPSISRSRESSGATPPFVRLADRRPQPTADRWYRVLVDDEVGSLQVTQFVGSIPPGRAPDHFHKYEEVLFILKGSGRLWARETNTPIAAGSCIFLPKGQVHCVENTGQSELRLMGVFYPAGSPSVRYDV